MNRIKILIVDDSAFARKVLREIMEGSDQIDVVGTARDGEEALEMVENLNPDLVICDLNMPVLDGVKFVQRQMMSRPLPILIVSSAPQDAAEVIEALSAGAVDVIQKPSALATDDLRQVRTVLMDKVAEAMQVPLPNLRIPELSKPALTRPSTVTGEVDVVVMGVSTGGPQALRRLLPLFPQDFPVPIAMVLHMPVGYTALYAEKLNELCAIEVKEAAEGDAMLPGRAILAMAGRHLTFRRDAAGRVLVHLSLPPLDKIHRPSVDVLFRSAAEVYQHKVLAVVMTGMGDDGTEGAAWVKAQGGAVLTESEKSCIIYGMPRSVAEAGLSDLAVPLDEMAAAITARL